jgi:hypothetical protein
VSLVSIGYATKVFISLIDININMKQNLTTEILVLLVLLGLIILSPVALGTDRYIYIDNPCCREVKLELVYSDATNNGILAPTGEYTISPCSKSHILWDQYGGVKTSNPTIYFYAYAVDGSKEWTGSNKFWVEGYNYPMRKDTLKVSESGLFYLRLSGCPEYCCNPLKCYDESKACHCGCIELE